MRERKLGTAGPAVSALGLGCMGMSEVYGPADEAESLATIAAALEAGITLLDTGDFYGMGHNEMLLRKALGAAPDGPLHGTLRDRVFIGVKFGALRDPAGAFVGFDARPANIKAYIAYTLRRLGTDHIDLYQPARLDPVVPIEETIGAIADLVKAGYVRHIGLSEAGPATIRRAHAVHPIAALQIEYSLMSRGIEEAILPVCRELGIAITAYGVLSRGLLSGAYGIDRPKAAGDMRAVRAPRFSADNLPKNLALVAALGRIGAAHGATPAQLAIAWVLSRGEDIIPLVGARKRPQLDEAVAAVDLALDPETLAAVATAVPPEAVAGARYDAHQMAMLDSERGPDRAPRAG